MNLKLTIFIFCFLQGCHNKNIGESIPDSKFVDNFMEFMEDIPISSDFDNYICIIVPMEGCNYCINKTLNKVMDDDSNLDFDVKVVLSSYGRKNIFFKIDSLTIHKYNFYTDINGTAIDLGLVREFPVLFYIKDGKLQTTIEINAPNSEQVLSLISE